MINKYVYDSIGNPHERKNIYLKDISNGIVTDKKSHIYNIKLNNILEEEKKFLKNLKDLVLKEKKEMKFKYGRRELNLRLELFEAVKKVDFYLGKENISYDFELKLKINQLKEERLPKILDLYSQSIKDMKNTIMKLSNLDKDENENSIRKYELKKAELEKKLDLDILKLKQSLNSGLISKKAYKNQLNQLKLELKDKLDVMKLEIPKIDLESKIKILKYKSKTEVDTLYKILYQDISDLERKIPIEVESVNKFIPFSSIILPGLGQYFNKQYFKAILFFLGALFIYLLAIPYILGYGNYRGEGLKGLITLAKGAKKLDKSIIFMIEGIIAILLMLFSIAISSLSYLDARNVLKDKLRGIRPRSSFETKETFKEDGFPYIVTTITFVLLSFVVILPILTTILLSFAGMDPNHQSKFSWVGLSNYKLLITGTGIAGGPFWLILGWTIVWTLLSSTLAIVVGFGLAIIANNERIKGKTLFRTIYLLPWAVPAFITIMFFSIMSSNNGYITLLLEKIFGGNLAIKNSATLTRSMLILLQTWLGSSYIFLLSTGVLQGIPSDLYEAADIDGATVWQKLTRITIPLVLFQTAPLLIGQYTFNFNNFSIIYLFNGGGPFDPTKYGNLAGSTDLLISYIFKLTIQKQYQSIGSAITVFISLGLMIFAYIGFKNSKAFKEVK